MGVIKKQSIASSILQGLGLVLSTVQLLIIFPAYLKPDQVGVVRLFIDLGFIAAPIFLLGTGSTYVRYFFHFKGSTSSIRRLKKWALGTNFLGFLGFSILFWLLLPVLEGLMVKNSPSFIPYLKYVPVLGLLVSLFHLTRALEQVHLKIQFANVLEHIVLRVLMILLAVSVYYSQLSDTQIVIGVIVCHAIISLLMITVHILNSKGQIESEVLSKDVFNSKELWSYAMFTFFIAVTDGVVIKLDTWMISSLVSMEAVGIYAIALQLGVLIEFPKRAISQSAVPQLSSEWSRNNLSEIANIYQRTSMMQLISGGLIFCGLMLSLDAFYKIIPNGELYQTGKMVVFYIGLGKWFAIATGANMEILQLSPYYKHSSWIRLSLLVIAIISNIIFIPIFGFVGAAMATALTFLVNNTLLTIVVWKFLKIQPFNIKSLKALFILISTSFVVFLLPMAIHPITEIIARTAIFFALSLPLLYFTKVSEDFRDVINGSIKRLKRN